MLLDKPTVIDALLSTVGDELRSLEAVAAMARDEATNTETRAEGKYDTRATEASYLARGQAWRIAELRRLHLWLETQQTVPLPAPECAQVGVLVVLQGAKQETVLMAPIGGAKVEVAGEVVRVISPVSPLGAAMVELEVGDLVEFDSPRGRLEYEIVALT